jgi:predicted acetyltransferase
MGLEIRDARLSTTDRTWLINVFPFYLHDLSAFDDSYYELDESGRWRPDHLPAWLHDANDLPLVILRDGRRVGFALVCRKPSPWVTPGCDYRMAEFFVLRRERRSGIGTRAAHAVFDAHPGRWEVSELARNERAIRFWRRVIGERTNDRYDESAEDDELRQVFRVRAPSTLRRAR